MRYDSEAAIVRNLEDAGCDQDTITDFVEQLRMGNQKDQLRLLEKHRKFLLERVHKEEKRIDCLDYLVYQISQHKVR